MRWALGNATPLSGQMRDLACKVTVGIQSLVAGAGVSDNLLGNALLGFLCCRCWISALEPNIPVVCTEPLLGFDVHLVGCSQSFSRPKV